MNRVIKFRAFNKKENTIELISDMYWFEENYVHSFDDDRFYFMQFTGLTDKKGVDIYEGDIVRTRADWNEGNADYWCEPQTVAVEYEAPAFGDFSLSDWWVECEVIGNIHENPELLGEEK